jgi:hypothetical protein
MRDESPRSPRTRTGITGAEGVVVVTVAIAVVAFEVWFFFFSGSPIGGPTLTGRHCPLARLRFVGHAPVAQLERAAAF